MQLTKIKIAGFKSFVDPTTIALPTNLIAIVGPNGCGKSNIIDAITWVMGESSAKYLRGELLTDVIFNGSSARKPIGQASVELIFDNQDGSLGGEYANYAEISIRRQITRDAESSYFLNGVRCRRRDIIDIFLGTGLGPRSYSIIGQNMISRIIEAKPDDMRVYLEEAAGVSKYKERRRETENRIQHTKENLERVNDVRTELDKQLAALKRQAQAAEKFKTLKQEERTLQAECLSMQWRELDCRMVEETLVIQQHATGLEAHQAELGEINLQLDYKRDEERVANEALQEVQRQYYALGNNITRLEQDIHHHKARHTQWQADITQAEQDYQGLQETFDDNQAELSELAEELSQLTPDFTQAKEEVKVQLTTLSRAEEAMQQWQGRWDSYNQFVAKNTQTAQVEQTRIQHLEQKLVSFKDRIAKLEAEKTQINFTDLTAEVEQLSTAVAELTQQKTEQQQGITQLTTELAAQQKMQQELQTNVDTLRKELQALQGQAASLQALQETALGKRNNPTTKWLATHKLDQRPRLAQGVEVAAGWEQAVEKVLGPYLQAVCLDQLSDITPLVSEFNSGSLTVVAKETVAKPKSTVKADTLLSKVTSSWPLAALLAHIYTADSVKEAYGLLQKLAPHESVITQDGVWLGASWLQMSHAENPETGIFQREQELKQLGERQEELAAKLTALEQQIIETKTAIKALEEKRSAAQEALNGCHAKLAEMQAQQKVKQERLKELHSRSERMTTEHQETVKALQQAEQELKHSRELWQAALAELEQQGQTRDDLTAERDQLRENLLSAREAVNTVKDTAHELEVRLQTTKSQHGALEQALKRTQEQMKVLTERKATLSKELQGAASIEGFEKDLAILLTQRLTLEEEVQQARNALEAGKQELTALETRRQEVEREAGKTRDTLEGLRVGWQGLKVKAETLQEQLGAMNTKVEDILSTLPEEAQADEWQARLEQVTQRISRLGAINLVAIEEYAACEERKGYLDKQYADLQEGLTTLENAILKIDKETRQRFKDTFDKVNERFQELFPKVFGGGKAYLELSGENLLDAGITVMACPPGKRNSTIHLLSGGEKAMTAIALVFSIFHLNPAPFCLLDEVDAPLDDANIGRYCHLVQSMAEKTQFIFISHNKLAIEMGKTLIGVTMNEPGVSRLVSVDVEEAISLASL